MSLVTICVLISSVSFFAYALSYFMAPHMKNEFKRFGLEKLGLMTIVLEIIGALGLLVGLKFNSLLITWLLNLTQLKWLFGSTKEKLFFLFKTYSSIITMVKFSRLIFFLCDIRPS